MYVCYYTPAHAHARVCVLSCKHAGGCVLLLRVLLCYCVCYCGVCVCSVYGVVLSCVMCVTVVCVLRVWYCVIVCM